MPTSQPPTVLKLGGSLARDGAHGALLETIMALPGAGHNIVVVPGGGAFADAVRRECAAAAASPTTAHWMAINAVDQMAYLLAGRMRGRQDRSGRSPTPRRPRPRLVRSAVGIARAVEQGRVPILAPFRWFREADPLPHTWDVTSDSIAAWVAARLDAQRLVLLKSVDGVRDDSETLLPAVTRTAIAVRTERKSGIVDAYFPRALAAHTECWIINGRHPERLRTLIEHGTTTGTLIAATASLRSRID